MVAVELGRPVQADPGPHRGHAPPQRALTEPLVGLLQQIRIRARPPQQEVGVRAVAAEVIDTAGVDVLGQGPGEQAFHLRNHGAAVRGQRVPRRKDRPGGVKKLGVKIACGWRVRTCGSLRAGLRGASGRTERIMIIRLAATRGLGHGPIVAQPEPPDPVVPGTVSVPPAGSHRPAWPARTASSARSTASAAASPERIHAGMPTPS